MLKSMLRGIRFSGKFMVTGAALPDAHCQAFNRLFQADGTFMFGPLQDFHLGKLGFGLGPVACAKTFGGHGMVGRILCK